MTEVIRGKEKAMMHEKRMNGFKATGYEQGSV
jgi:hypothetical protein